jgi:hypothetical protein
MAFGDDSIRYKYKFKIDGRTLVIRVEADYEYSNKVRTFELDRSEQCQNPEAIAVPYLPLFHILFSNNIFTTFFVDWEVSNASKIVPYDGSHYPYNNNSVRYAQTLYYNPKTNGIRNRMLETFYLTTSPYLDDVFANIANPQSPLKDTCANYIIWDYRFYFKNLIKPSSEKFMDIIYNAGVRNVWIQIHNWQKIYTTLNGNPVTRRFPSVLCK